MIIHPYHLCIGSVSCPALEAAKSIWFKVASSAGLCRGGTLAQRAVCNVHFILYNLIFFFRLWCDCGSMKVVEHVSESSDSQGNFLLVLETDFCFLDKWQSATLWCVLEQGFFCALSCSGFILGRLIKYSLMPSAA